MQGEAFTGSQGLVPLNSRAGLSGRPVRAATGGTLPRLPPNPGAAARGPGQRALLRVRNEAQESALGNLVADAQLAATRAPETGGAQLSFMNPGGLRADLVPDAQGPAAVWAVFQRSAVWQQHHGAHVHRCADPRGAGATVSPGGTSTPQSLGCCRCLKDLATGYDLSQPAGSRISQMTLHGKPLEDTAVVRVAISNFWPAVGMASRCSWRARHHGR